MSFRADLVAIRSADGRDWSRFGQPMVAIGRDWSCWARRLVAIRSRFVPIRSRFDVEDKTQKSPIPYVGDRAAWRLYVSRVSMLRLIPLSSTRASVRNVRPIRARRSCIVTITADRRHIARYILQSMRIHEQS